MLRSKSFVALALGAIALVGKVDNATAQWSVYVGYADGLRASPFFPSIWSTSSVVQWFNGSAPPGSVDLNVDAGAVGILNTSGGNITINSLLVNGFFNGASYNLWGGPIILNANKWAIFTQTTAYNFDTSDQPQNPCGVSNNATPHVRPTIGGSAYDYADAARVLNTGGFDLALCTFQSPFTGDNESLNWRLIGTSGLENPGGSLNVTPEPATMSLLAMGLAGMAGAGFRRRKRN